jgi:hypothetical protein
VRRVQLHLLYSSHLQLHALLALLRFQLH